MLINAFIKLSERFPSFRRWAWQRWYQHIAKYHQTEWSFMNYGFLPDDGSTMLQLDPADEPDRHCIQLYEAVVSGVDLSGKDVLEVGSGRGGGASFIAHYHSPATVHGVDFSSKAVKLCRQRHHASGLHFHHGYAESLPFDDDQFGVVINVESSHCYASADKFFSEARRVLKPGGYFLFADFRAVEEIDLLNRQLEISGFETIDVSDITANVVSAMKADSQRKQLLIQTHVGSWLSGTFGQFAGLAGTPVYESFVAGDMVYLRYCLRNSQV